MHSISIVIICIAFLIADSGAAAYTDSSTFLAGASLKIARARMKARGQLLQEAQGLADALRDELGVGALWPRSTFPIDLVDDARRRLWQEADGFLDDGAGDLLRDYATYAPAHVLVVPSAFPFEAMARNDALNSSSEYSSVTESTMTGGDGQVITRTMTCENGVCKRHVQKRGGPEVKLVNGTAKGASEVKGGSVDMLRSSRGHKLANRIAAESRQLAQDMQRMQTEFGNDGFEDIVGDIFGMPHLTMPNITGPLVGSGSKVSSSKMSETSIKNGHVVQKTKICKDGKCRTTSTERDLKPPAAEAKKTLDHDAVVDSGTHGHIPRPHTTSSRIMPILLRHPSARM